MVSDVMVWPSRVVVVVVVKCCEDRRLERKVNVMTVIDCISQNVMI